MKQYRRVYAQIDLDAVAYNLKQMQEHLPAKTQMIAVVKMDGYGHGATPIAKMLEHTDYIWGYATASFEEAVVLRKAQIKKPILVLGCIFEDQYEEMLELDIRATVYTAQMAKEMSEAAHKAGKKVYFHIKIDTGMGRLGFPVCEESADLIAGFTKLPNVELEGLFTHFAKADEKDRAYTIMQHERFIWMQNALQNRGIHIPYHHCDNSAGILNFPEMGHDLVRAGIAAYGLYPSKEVEQTIVNLKPALELISHVTFVKDIEPGTAISYGGTFISDEKMRIATVPVGYGDGYPRALSNKAYVLIRGKRAPILGRVCMDQFMVDVTHIPHVEFGERAVLIGTDGKESIPVELLSDISGRFNYEFVCGLGKRVPRVYIQNGEVVEQIDYLS